MVNTFFIFTHFCLFWPFVFLLFFAFLAGCINSCRLRVFLFVLFVYFTFLYVFTFFALYEFLYFSVLCFTRFILFCFFVLIAGAGEFFFLLLSFCVFALVVYE